MRRFLLQLALLAIVTLATATPTMSQGTPFEINVILPVTGAAAFAGGEEAGTYGILQDVVNRTGGIKGRPVRFVVQDDASVPQTSVQLLNALIGKSVQYVLGSSLAATCGSMMPIVDHNGGPVMYCLSPILLPPPGSYAFSGTVSPRDFEPIMLRFLRQKGWTRIGILNSIDATGQSMEKGADEALGSADGRGLTVVGREHFAAGDISVVAQAARLKAQSPQVVLSFAAGAPFGTLLHGLRDAGLDVPVIGAAGNMVRNQLTSYAGFTPRELFFFVGGGIAPNQYAPATVRSAERVYFAALKAAGKEPGIPAAVAWDTGMLAVDMYRALGTNATSSQIRSYFDKLRGWAGVLGLYDFRQFPNRGLGPSATVVYRWDPDKNDFTVVPLPAAR
jgi:branched-chain amino acid transport system substrate-binding protein